MRVHMAKILYDALSHSCSTSDEVGPFHWGGRDVSLDGSFDLNLAANEFLEKFLSLRVEPTPIKCTFWGVLVHQGPTVRDYMVCADEFQARTVFDEKIQQYSKSPFPTRCEIIHKEVDVAVS